MEREIDVIMDRLNSDIASISLRVKNGDFTQAYFEDSIATRINDAKWEVLKTVYFKSKIIFVLSTMWKTVKRMAR